MYMTEINIDNLEQANGKRDNLPKLKSGDVFNAYMGPLNLVQIFLISFINNA